MSSFLCKTYFCWRPCQTLLWHGFGVSISFVTAFQTCQNKVHQTMYLDFLTGSNSWLTDFFVLGYFPIWNSCGDWTYALWI